MDCGLEEGLLIMVYACVGSVIVPDFTVHCLMSGHLCMHLCIVAQPKIKEPVPGQEANGEAENAAQPEAPSRVEVPVAAQESQVTNATATDEVCSII